MSTESNKERVKRIFEALDQRNLEGVVAHYAPGCRLHGWAPQTLDVNGYQAAMSALLAGFPDSRFIVDDIVADGNLVAVRHRFQGTHRAEFQGIPATGKSVTVNAIVLIRFENGAAAELWLNADFLGLLQQLGVIPAPQAG